MADPPIYEWMTAVLRARAAAQRILFVEPDKVDTMRAAVEARGWSEFVTVVASTMCPPGQILLSRPGIDLSGYLGAQR